MGEIFTTSIEQRLEAKKRIGGEIDSVSAEITNHLLAEHHISPGAQDYLDVFASHIVFRSFEYKEPERVIVYNSAARNRVVARINRARTGGRRWVKDVTDF